MATVTVQPLSRRARQTGITGSFPIESDEYTVGGSNFKTLISAAITDVSVIDDSTQEWTVEVRYEPLRDIGFEPAPLIIITVNGSEIWRKAYGNTSDGVLHEPETLTFQTSLGDGGYDCCIEMHPYGEG